MDVDHSRRMFAAGLFALGIPAGAASANPRYPARPIRIVVPYPPSGGGDGQTRLVAARLAEQFGQPVIVENKPGANGAIGTAEVARAPADGYTLLFVTAAQVLMTPMSNKDAGFKLEDLAPVGGLSRQPLFLTVPYSSPFRSVGDLIAAGKAGGASVAYASAGVGSLSHLLGEMLNARTGANFTHVPYKGVSQIVVALLSNEVTYSFVIGSAAMGQFKANRLRPIAVLGTGRSSLMPDVPTMQEAGLDGFSLNTWFGFMAPAATPGPIINVLQRQLAKILNEPEIRNKLEQVVAEPWPATPDEFAAVLRAEASLYEAAARNAGIATR
jgi:tripartite-type tricarboxylate transporter receptor subunit TctC